MILASHAAHASGTASCRRTAQRSNVTCVIGLPRNGSVSLFTARSSRLDNTRIRHLGCCSATDSAVEAAHSQTQAAAAAASEPLTAPPANGSHARSSVALPEDSQQTISAEGPAVAIAAAAAHETAESGSQQRGTAAAQAGEQSGSEQHAAAAKNGVTESSNGQVVAVAEDGAGPPSFEQLGLDSLLVAGLRQQNILTPSDIQAAAIPVVLAGENCAIQSFTGSGKTLAFLLPIMNLALARADEELRRTKGRVSVQAVVVSPSQELAMQTVRVAQSLLPPAGRAMVQQIIGGANPHRQREALSLGRPALVVGTPGRLAEMMRLGYLRVHQCRILVLDEADQLMAPNFSEDMAHLVGHTGKKLEAGVTRQTVLASATLTEAVLAKTSRWCPQPNYVTVNGPLGPRLPSASDDRDGSGTAGGSSTAGDGSSSSEGAAAATDVGARAAAAAAAAASAKAVQAPEWGWGVKGWDGAASNFDKIIGGAGGVLPEGDVPPMPPQVLHYYVVSQRQHKADTLRRLVYARDLQRALVFVNYQQRTKDVQFRLEGRGMKAAALHGELGKMQRAAMLESFRRGNVRVLAVSDVAARGLDVADCDAVVHLELPSSAPHYAHRAGRTGRMGAPGVVFAIVAPDEVHVVQRLGKSLGIPILEAHLADGQMLLGPDPDASRRPPAEEQQSVRSRSSSSSDSSSNNNNNDLNDVDGSAQASASDDTIDDKGETPKYRVRKDGTMRTGGLASSSGTAAGATAASRDRDPSAAPRMVAAPSRGLSAVIDAAASSSSSRNGGSSSSSSSRREEDGVDITRGARGADASAPTSSRRSTAAAAASQGLSPSSPSSSPKRDPSPSASELSSDPNVAKVLKRTLMEVFSSSLVEPSAGPRPASTRPAQAAAVGGTKAAAAAAKGKIAAKPPPSQSSPTAPSPVVNEWEASHSSPSSRGQAKSADEVEKGGSGGGKEGKKASAAKEEEQEEVEVGDDEEGSSDDDEDVDDKDFDAALLRSVQALRKRRQGGAPRGADGAGRGGNSSAGSSSSGALRKDATAAPGGGGGESVLAALRRELEEIKSEKGDAPPGRDRARSGRTPRGRTAPTQRR